jgi:hypothetical protein
VTQNKLHKNAVNSKKVSKNSLNGRDIDEKTRRCQTLATLSARTERRSRPKRAT